VPTILEQAAAYFKAGEIEKARFLLIAVLRQNPGDENAWLWLSRCVTETEQKRYCFEKALRINPQNQYTIRSLRHLTRPVSTKLVSPPGQSTVSPQQSIRKWGLGEALLTIAIFGVGFFLVLLFLYAWWLAR
jgi:Tfp pilus assembly protein PilF